MEYKLVVRRKGVGDTVAISPLVRDLHRFRPDIRISVEGTLASEIFKHDPRVSTWSGNGREVVIDYKPTHDRARFDKSARYLLAGLEDFNLQTGLSVPAGDPRPELVLLDEERPEPSAYPYIVLASGVKLDMPLKRYPHNRWAELVRLGSALGWKFRQVGQIHDGRLPHIQEAIPGADNLLGKTSIRQLFRVISGAAAVVCHVSLPMLIASAFRVPCIVLGGGRENPWLFADMGVDYLHTIGELGCCQLHGCHACFAKPAHDGAYPPGSLCADPVECENGSAVGRCMTLIEPSEIVDRLSVLVRP